MVETFSKKIIRIGDSLGFLVPNEIVGRYKLKEGDDVTIALEFEDMGKEMSKGTFRLWETYYRNGFFNTNKSFPRFKINDDFSDIKNYIVHMVDDVKKETVVKNKSCHIINDNSTLGLYNHMKSINEKTCNESFEIKKRKHIDSFFHPKKDWLWNWARRVHFDPDYYRDKGVSPFFSIIKLHPQGYIK